MSAIEWTDETWNPTVGCSEISPGCDHCYAVGVATRQMQPAHVGLTIGRRWTGEVRQLPDRLDTPLHWTRPRKVFVDSMSDLFHRDVDLGFLNEVWKTMEACPQHTFQILTKRSRRMRQLLNGSQHGYEHLVPWIGRADPLPNVWLGTSIENDSYCFRADDLRETRAARRFLSLEPLLGPLPSLNLDGIDWVIAGGESGGGARPMHPHWVRGIRDRCGAAGVPFLFKQWGAWAPYTGFESTPKAVRLDGSMRGPDDEWAADDFLMVRVGKTVAGRVLDGRTWDEYPVEAQR